MKKSTSVIGDYNYRRLLVKQLNDRNIHYNILDEVAKLSGDQ